MSEQPTPDQGLTLKSYRKRSIDFKIDRDGDLMIENEEGNITFFVLASQLHELRDWLNKVVP